MSRIATATRMRLHREEMQFAVSHQMTLAEARAEMARLRWIAAQARIADRRQGRGASAPMPNPISTPQEQRPDPSDRWMMRN